MTKNKQNMVEAQELVRNILEKNFNQKVTAKSVRTAAEKLLETVPAPKAVKTAA
jgi:hypothetical protein